MKQTLMKLAVLLVGLGLPVGSRTANAAESPEAEAPVDTSEIGLLCRGAGVSKEDVLWRIEAGLEPKQAVDAALAQKENDERNAAAAAKAKKGGK